MKNIANFFSLLFSLSLVFGCASTPEKSVEPAAEKAKTPTAKPAEKKPDVVADDVPLGKLPTDVRPTHYVLDIDVDPRNDSFKGLVTIDVTFEKARDFMWLHGAKVLDVKSVVLEIRGESIVGTWQSAGDAAGEVGKITFSKTVLPGDGQLKIAYSAPYDTQLEGIYKVKNAGDDYVFTQFEATSFRHSFPSFDEPRFKTPFQSIVSVHKDDKVVSNTPEEKREVLDDGRVRVTFMKTPPLPTYLIAYAVGPLDIVKAASIPPNEARKDPLPFNGVTVKGKGAQLGYALKHTPGILKALEEYFGGRYPFKKLSVIAVPDFASGAMENAGAVTFREVLLLVDEKNASTRQVRWFHSVMSHELAHMWFGDLVTMPWWDDIWLNEAFATWMSFKGVHNYNPNLGADVDPVRRSQEAMGVDSLVSARQIRNPIESNDDIRNAFDGITYSKGSAVLGMFESYIGKEKFQQGIRQYMSDHAFSSATYEDLLKAFSDAAGQDIAPAFKTFLFQPGVPFLQVKTSCPTEGEHAGKTVVDVAQSRYLPVGSKGDTKKMWQIPFCAEAMVGDKRVRKCALVDKVEQTALTFEGCANWLHPNPSGAGYYRFSMPQQELAQLLDAGDKVFDVPSRMAAADAVTASFRKGALSAEDTFKLLPKITNDAHPAIAQKPMGIIGFAAHNLVDEKQLKKVQSFARKLYKKPLKRLGMKPRKTDDGDTRQLRAGIIRFLIGTGADKRLQKKMAKKGKKMVKKDHVDLSVVDGDLAGIALFSAMREGNTKFHARLMELLKTEENPVARSHLMSAALAAHDDKKFAAALPLLLDARLRTNEVFSALQNSMGAHETREKAWAYFEANGDAILARFPTTAKGWAPWIGAGFCNKEQHAKVNAFFEPRLADLMGAPRNLAGALEAIELCEAQVHLHQASSNAFFK
ncbi:MAG: M1 family metallopeptidase [Deltaproteobacteria bacterium]|nr:M1 family metallopeptidase [Deltaproteobacteria bacterium]